MIVRSNWVGSVQHCFHCDWGKYKISSLHSRLLDWFWNSETRQERENSLKLGESIDLESYVNEVRKKATYTNTDQLTFKLSDVFNRPF